MSKKILRPLAVIVCSCAMLLGKSASAKTPANFCNQTLPQFCGGWSDDTIRSYCDEVCPGWVVAYCEDGVYLNCADPIEQ